MVHHHLGDSRALPASIDGDEAMHLPVEPYTLQHLATISFDRAAKIVQPHSRDGADQPVGDLRRKLAAELGFLSILPPATHHIVSSSGLLGAVVQPAIQLVQKQADV